MQWCVNRCIACRFGAACGRAETGGTIAARSSWWGETVGTFARVKCLILRHCGRAKASLVSCAPVNELAKAVAVSLRREKVRPARPGVCVSAKKFAPQARNGRKRLFSGVLGEFFRARAVGSPVLGEFFRANRHCARSCKRRAPSMLAVVGVLHYTRQSHSVSPACRTLM